MVMHKLEAMRILEAKLKSIQEERHAELAESEDLRSAIDAKAEAQALSAVFDFLKTCKIAPSNSLLRIFRRYLRTPRTQDAFASKQQHPFRG
jgi:hypothetical protein